MKLTSNSRDLPTQYPHYSGILDCWLSCLAYFDSSLRCDTDSSMTAGKQEAYSTAKLSLRAPGIAKTHIHVLSDNLHNGDCETYDLNMSMA